jgi:hypothetical protein
MPARRADFQQNRSPTRCSPCSVSNPPAVDLRTRLKTRQVRASRRDMVAIMAM